MAGGAHVYENLVIGGGPAGAMAALRLAGAGREVLLLEKERDAKHKVCGEFLSPETVEYLAGAGVDAMAAGAASIHSLRLSAKSRVVETRLPFAAASLSRFVMDEALLARAADAGCDVRRGVTVRRLEHEADGWIAHLADGTAVRAGHVMLATGKHDVTGWNRPPASQNDLVGLKMHWRLLPEHTQMLRGWMDLFLFPDGYGGLALVEEGRANLCLVVRRARLREAGGWPGLVRILCRENCHMNQRLEGAEPLWERPLAISSIPYGYMTDCDSGVWRVGDQAAVIPSFTGDGMAIALHSGALAAEMRLEGKTAGQYQFALREQLRRGMKVATVLSRAMVSRAGQELASLLIPLLPQPIGWIARLTRIPQRELRVSAGFARGAQARIAENV